MAFAQNIRHLARKAAAATAITATASCEDAPTLREWLEKDTFSAAFSQGFGCEAASIGVALGLADGVGGPRQLRKRLDGVAGRVERCQGRCRAGRGPNCPLEAFEALVKRMRFRDALLDFDDLALYEGGWARLSTFRKHFSALVGGRDVQALDMLPFATTAFDLKSMRSDILSEDLWSWCALPRERSRPCSRRSTSAHYTRTWPSSRTRRAAAGFSASPESRVLQVCHADVPFNGPWVVESPASLNVREVCSVVLTGNTRVVPLPPGARLRVSAALDGAREAVVAALDRPLERVAPGHYVCRVSPAKTRRGRRGRAGAVGARRRRGGGGRGGSEAAVM